MLRNAFQGSSNPYPYLINQIEGIIIGFIVELESLAVPLFVKSCLDILTTLEPLYTIVLSVCNYIARLHKQ